MASGHFSGSSLNVTASVTRNEIIIPLISISALLLIALYTACDSIAIGIR